MEHTKRKSNSGAFRNSDVGVLFICGVAIGLALLSINGMSDALAIHLPVERQPLAVFVGLLSAAGLVYAVAVFRCRKVEESGRLEIVVLVFAAVLRLAMFGSMPIQEDDHYRYLWDGALVACGVNPYAHAPGDAAGGEEEEEDGSVPSELAELARESGGIHSRINYPWLRTIYPPVAQAAFGLAHVLSPWSFEAWRLLLAFFDLAALALLWRSGCGSKCLMVYAWNPLLIKEVYNSCHVDALMLPLLVAAALAARKDRPLTATAAICAATGVKLWPVLLMPAVWRRLLDRPRVLIGSMVLFAACLAGTFLPIFLSGLDRTSGLAAYCRYWEMNDALYMLVEWVAGAAGSWFSIPFSWEALLPRVAAAALVIGAVAWIGWHREIPVERQFLMASTCLFLLSPTQFPWYYLWLMPFLALHPHPALVLYAALLPLYYLRPLFEHNGLAGWFDRGVVWIEHGPVILWLAMEGVFGPREGESKPDRVPDGRQMTANSQRLKSKD